VIRIKKLYAWAFISTVVFNMKEGFRAWYSCLWSAYF